MERSVRARGSFANWALLTIGCSAGASVAVVIGYVVLPALATPATLLAGLFLCLFLVSVVMMLFRMAQYFFFRHAYYKQLPATERKAAYDAELRSRHAPGWYVRLGRTGRLGYVLGVFLVATAVMLIRPFPGDEHFAVRMAGFVAAFIVVVAGFWLLPRLRR
jgi:hypothetical protein